MRQAVQLNPSTDNFLYLAACLREQDDSDSEAKELFSRILAENPNHYEALWSMGLLADDLQEAFNFFSRASQIKPDDWRMHNNMGWALAQMQRFEEALGAFEQARRVVHENPADISIAIAGVYQDMGRYKEALENAERATIENPDSQEARELLAEIKVAGPDVT